MRSGRDAVAAVAVFGAGLAYLYLFHTLGWFMEDEGVLYYHYLRVYQGLVPYRDFFTGYGPLIYYVHAAAFALLGVSINATRVLMAVVNATTAAGLYLVARRCASPGWSVAVSALFLALQPGDIAVMVFHNSPYPSWWALAFTVWGTWALLRWTESDPPRPAWLVLTGFLGGLVLFSKQNAGVFFLWGVTGALATLTAADTRAPAVDGRVARVLQVGYLALIPLGCVLVVRTYLGVATCAAFVLPAVGLALYGAHTGSGPASLRPLLGRFLCVALGVGIATGPWVAYFGYAMGVGPFLRAVFFVGADVERNLYVAFPALEVPTLWVLALVVAWCGLLGWERRVRRRGPRETDVYIHRARRGLVLLVIAGSLGLFAWYRSTLLRALRLEYNLWQIYSFVSDGIDNLAAYLSVLVLWLGVAVLWAGRGRTSGRQPCERAALVVLVWLGACSFVLFYPRMDFAHLYGAMPLVSAVGVGLLGVTGLQGRWGRRVIAAIIVATVGLKTAPKVYSRVMVERSGGVRLVATPVEWVDFPRAHLYFPIYLARQRTHLAAFRDLVEYVRATTPTGSKIFAFPALPMLYFLSDRDNPTRHDYFLGDNVGFAEQLEVMRTLDREAVPLVVVMNDPTNYFVERSADVTRVLRDYLATQYYRERRIGPYDVLRRYGSAPPGDRPA